MHACQGCGEEFETLTRKRLHQQDGCQGQFDHIEAGDRDTGVVARETTAALLTCQNCETVHDGDIVRGDDFTQAGYSLEITFDCEDCGFHNVNTAVMEGTAP